jgi:hypothetical protein
MNRWSCYIMWHTNETWSLCEAKIFLVCCMSYLFNFCTLDLSKVHGLKPFITYLHISCHHGLMYVYAIPKVTISSKLSYLTPFPYPLPWKAKLLQLFINFKNFTSFIIHYFFFLTSLFKSSLSKWSLKLKIKDLFNCSSTFHITFHIKKWSQIKI